MIRATYKRPWWFVPLQDLSRRLKFRLFLKLMKPTPRDTVLDVGSGAGTFLELFYPWPHNIVALDLSLPKLLLLRAAYPQVSVVVGDAVRLPFPDNSIDIVFCNAVLEHIPVPTREAVATEIRRVASRYFVAVPNQWFPFEPHSKTLFCHWLPRHHFLATLDILRRLRLVRTAPSFYFELPTPKEMSRLFPDAVTTLAVLASHIISYRG